MVPAGGPAFTLTLLGTSFDARATVRLNGAPIAARVLSTTLIHADVPASAIVSPGTGYVAVANPDGKESVIGIRVTTDPLLYRCTPNGIPVGSPSFTLVCTGANFLPGATLRWEGAPLATTFVSSTELRVAVPAALVAKAGFYTILVFNPDGVARSEHGVVSVIVPPPAGRPTISSGSPGIMVLGSAYDIMLQGSNFVPGSIIRFGARSLETRYISSTELEAHLPPSSVTFAGDVQVTVVNPDGLTSVPSLWQVVGQPELDTISPTSIAWQAPAFTLTATGRGFARDAAIMWYHARLDTVRVSDTTLTAYLPAAYMGGGVGAVAIRVSNAYGAVSPARSLTVNGLNGSPILSIAGWSAPGVAPGSSNVSFTVYGSGFLPGATVLWDGVALTTTRIGMSVLEATLPARLYSSMEGSTIEVVNPDREKSNSVWARIRPTTLESLSPDTIVAGVPIAGALLGRGAFQEGTALYWNGTRLTTSPINNSLQALVPRSFYAAPGNVSITAVAPNGASSPPITLRITSPTPAVSGVSAGELMAGDPSSVVTVAGSGFLPTSVVTWNGTALVTTYGNPTVLRAAVPAELLASPGTVQVRVRNGDESASNPMTVPVPLLAIDSIAPASAQAGAAGFTLTVSGSFKSTSVVQWNQTPLPTTFVSAARLTAAIPAALVAAGGSAAITVANPGGATSAAAAFEVVPRPLSIASGGVVNAASAAASIAPGSLISIYAAGLPARNSFAETAPLPTELNGISVLINGRRAPLLFTGASQINAQVPYEIPPGPASVVLTGDGVTGEVARIDVRPAAPGILTIPGGNHAVAQNADYSLNSAANPARPGQYVVLYLTGQGLVEPPVATGVAAPSEPLSLPIAAVEATIGGRPARVLFAGLTPGLAGVLQVNLEVAPGVSGELPAVVTIGGVASPPAILSVAAN